MVNQIMVKIDGELFKVVKLSVETHDFELPVCVAKMSRSIKNVTKYYLLDKTPVFFHLSKNGNIEIVLPTNIKRKDT